MFTLRGQGLEALNLEDDIVGTMDIFFLFSKFLVLGMDWIRISCLKMNYGDRNVFKRYNLVILGIKKFNYIGN